MEENSKLPLPEAFLNFLKVNGIDPSIYTASDTVPRYIRYPRKVLPSFYDSVDFVLFCKVLIFWSFLLAFVSEILTLAIYRYLLFWLRLKPGNEAFIGEIEAEIKCKLEKVDWLAGFHSLPPDIQIANSTAYQQGQVRMKRTFKTLLLYSCWYCD